MPSNSTLNTGSGGDIIATKQRSHDGDTTQQQMVGLSGVSGTEDSYTFTDVQAGGGTEANALRVTIANDSTGVVSVDDGGGSLTVDGTVAVSNLSGTIADDSAFTVGSDEVAVMGALADETATDSVDEGDVGAVRMSLDRRLLVDADISDGGGSITVDGTVTANLSATDNAVLDNIQTAVETIDNAISGNEMQVDVITMPTTTVTGTVTANLSATDNTVLDNIDTSLNNIEAAVSGSEMQVDIVSMPAVDLGANNDVTVQGENAHDGTTLGNPVLGGARATNNIEGLTQVANADLTHLQADLNGVLITRPYTTPEEILSERVSNTNGTSTAFTNFPAGGAGVHNYVTTISIYNSSATDGYVDFRDGTGGSVIFTAAAPAAGGSVINLPVPLKGAANTALAYDVSGALSTVYISVVGYQAQG